MVNTNKLKGAIKEAGYTQEEVAKKLGIDRKSFNRKVNGKSDFWIKEVIDLCDILKIGDNNKKFEIFLS